MQLKPFSFKQFLLKVCLLIAIFYSFIIEISILITGFLFFSLNSYKGKIEKVVYQHTGYTISINNISPSLSSAMAPEITINNIRLTNPTDPNQAFFVKQIQISLSYSSIWHLEPIFDQVNIDGTELNIELLTDGSIILNGINLNNPKRKLVEPNKNKFDFEKWILKQNQIKLSHIDVSFVDKKNKLPKLELYNITAILQNSYKHKHSIFVTIGRSKEDQRQMLGTRLTWIGGKVTDIQDWKEAELRVQSYRENDQVSGTLQQYIPSLSILDRFNADTAVDAQIKNGKLQFFYANFDIQNLTYALKHHQNLINFPQLGGSIKISLVNNDHYSLLANNLTVATPDGYIFNNKSISGNYNIDKNGYISIFNTDLTAFNNLVAYFPIARKLSISGEIEVVKFSWDGKITHPESYNVSAKFTDLSIKSKDENIPGIDHIYGDVSVNKNNGFVNLVLKKSTLNYPKIFLIPYKFNSLSSQISWQINTDKSFDVTLGRTTIDEIDFKGYAEGKFIYTPGTNGFLDLKAHIDRMKTSKVGDYLPSVIGMPVHKWLNKGLIGGDAVNANLTLKGWLANFPFNDGNGQFYIDADIDHAKLLYVENWPTLDDIIGKFQIRNQKIIIVANSAKISGNNIDKATVVIPDMTASDKVYLTADGLASGSTTNFMTYLSQTPINEIIGKIPEKITTSGNGIVKLHLMVPFSDPMHTKVDGSYSFENNSIQFDMPIPLLTNTNGSLFFSEHGLKIDQLNTNALNSNAIIATTTDSSGVMHFTVDSPNLDFKALSSYYLQFLKEVINGKAATKITFDIGKKGINQLTAQSNLQGVTIFAPAPIGKESSTISSMQFAMHPNNNGFNINFNYAKTLFGNVILNKHGKPDQTLISVGSSKLPQITSNLPKTMISVNTESLDGIEWLLTVFKITKSSHESKPYTPVPNLMVSNDNQYNKMVNESKAEIFPIEVVVNTDNMMMYSTNYYHTNADILVLKDIVLFNINNTLTNGFGSFDFPTKTLALLLNEFNILKAIDTVETSKKEKLKSTSSGAEFANLNRTRAFNENNMTKFEESKLFVNRQNLKPIVKSITSEAIHFPSVGIAINDLYYENVRLAQAKIKLKPQGMDLLVESGEIIGDVTHTTFHGTNFCMECGTNKAFVELMVHLEMRDLGQMIENLGYGPVLAKGSGTADVTLQWNGKLQDFQLSRTIASIKIDLTNGKFLKVSTGSIFGEVLGIINLQTITNIAHLDFSDAFSNGFYFGTLKVRAYLLNNVLTIKSLYMSGPLAIVQSYGTINITHETLDSYLNVTPRLGASIAVGAAAATLNPIVGLVVYAGEWILGQPFNKLFSFGYHITGSLKKPTITKIKISDQVLNNLNATLGGSMGGIGNDK